MSKLKGVLAPLCPTPLYETFEEDIFKPINLGNFVVYQLKCLTCML